MSPIQPQDLSSQHAHLRRLARAIVGESYADDIVQDVWAAALARPGPAPHNWGAWLNRVTRNIAWKSRVKDQRARARDVDRARLGIPRSADIESPEALIADVEGATGASAAAVSVVALKWAAAAAVAALLFTGGRSMLRPAGAVELAAIAPVRVADVPQMAVAPPALAEVPEVATRIVTGGDRAPQTAPAIAALAAPSGEGTTILVTEASSGKPLPGVTVEVHHAYMKRRGLFFKSTNFATLTVTTDDTGRAVIPVETNSEGLSAGNSLSASIRTGDHPGAEVYLEAAASKKYGVVQLQLARALVFRVRLPETLTEEESGALAATMVVDRGPFGVNTDSRIHKPVAVHGRDLMFAIHEVGDETGAGTLHIATTGRGRTFHAAIPEGVNLASEPVHATRADDVTHTFRLVHDVTGEPLPEQSVSVRRPTTAQPYANCEALGTTDDDGATQLIGIPPGKVTVVARAEGFEEYRSQAVLSPGATSEIRLSQKAGLRSVRLEVAGLGAEIPNIVYITAMTNDRLSTKVASLSLTPIPARSGGWTVSATLEHIPGEVCFLEAYAHPRRYHAIGPVRIEPGQDEVQLHFGEAHKLTSVRLRLPPMVVAIDQQKAGDGPLYSMPGKFTDGDVVGFRREQPIAGVTVFDDATGEVLGVTDDTGYAVISAAEPVQRIGARYGEVTKTFDLEGGPGMQFGF